MKHDLRIMENKIKTFKDLNAWKESHLLILEIYKLTEKFPSSEIFGLTNQIRRASVSISSNIAEGFSRQSYKEKTQFYSIALGSLSEVQSQITIALDLKYTTKSKYTELEERTIIVSKLLNGLIKKSKTLILNS